MLTVVTETSSNMAGFYLGSFLIFLPTLLLWTGRIILFALLALARLYGVSAEELVKQVQE